MSGTRKMEKFEIDVYTRACADDRAEPLGLETQAAAAIAELQPGALLDRLEDRGAAHPALPFERRGSGGSSDADLPAVPFESRGQVGSGTNDVAGAPVADAAVAGAWVPGEWVPPQQAQPLPSDAGAKKDVEALRTRLTQKFVSLADSVTEDFRDFAIGAGAYAVELTAPQGMSTGGGKQALQHLRLRPRRDGYPVLVAGTVNQVERRAELRDYDHIMIMNQVRFRTTVDIGLQEWEQFLRKAEVVLNGAGIQSMRTPPPRELLEQRRNMERVSKGALAALMVVLLLAAVVVWRVFVALGSG